MSSPLDEIAPDIDALLHQFQNVCIATGAGIAAGVSEAQQSARATERAIYRNAIRARVQRLHARVQELEREQSEPHGWSHTSNAPYPRD